MIRRVLLALLLSTATATAQETAPRVSVGLTPEGPVTVGAPLSLRITLLVPTYMPSPPVWPDPQIADAITRLPANASHATSAQVAGESWAGITRVYEIIAQSAAEYILPPSEITATYADPLTGDPVTASVPLPEIIFTATIPPGAEGLDPFLSATDLTLTAEIEGLTDLPEPGDAITLTLTTTATGTQAMLLPPLLDGSAPPGLRAYASQPALIDTPGDRGDPSTASRIESVTYVIEQPGDFTLPARSLGWWNTDRQRLETATTDPLTFAVAPPEGWQADTGPPRPARALIWIAALLLATAAAASFHPRMRAIWRAARDRRARSEPLRYRALRRAVADKGPSEIRASLRSWQEAAGTKGPLPAPIAQDLTARERVLYGAPATRPAAGSDDLAARIATYRRDLLHRKSPRPDPLSALNPSFGAPRP